MAEIVSHSTYIIIISIYTMVFALVSNSWKVKLKGLELFDWKTVYYYILCGMHNTMTLSCFMPVAIMSLTHCHLLQAY